MSRWSTLVLTAVSVLALTSGTVIDTDSHPARDGRSPATALQMKTAKDANWCC